MKARFGNKRGPWRRRSLLAIGSVAWSGLRLEFGSLLRSGLVAWRNFVFWQLTLWSACRSGPGRLVMAAVVGRVVGDVAMPCAGRVQRSDTLVQHRDTVFHAPVVLGGHKIARA